MRVVATSVVVDAIAIADVEAVLGAIPPDRALHKPRKRRREGWIELASINVRREQPENASAPSRPVAPVSISMVGAQPPQDPGPVQEIVDQRVDSDECRAHFEPQGSSLAGAHHPVESPLASPSTTTPGSFKSSQFADGLIAGSFEHWVRVNPTSHT